MNKKKLKSIFSLLILSTVVLLVFYIEKIHMKYEENQLNIQKCFDNFEGEDVTLSIEKYGFLSVVMCEDNNQEQNESITS